MAESEALQLLADVYQALSNPKRLQIVKCLVNGEKSVTQILACKQFLETPQTTVSQHLALLRQAGLVTVRREGTNVFYKLSNPKVLRLLNLAREIVSERFDGLQRVAARA
jgi:ArsR family transcriptional regulator